LSSLEESQTFEIRPNSLPPSTKYCPLSVKAKSGLKAKLRIDLLHQSVPAYFSRNDKQSSPLAKVVSGSMYVPADWEVVFKWSDSISLKVTLLPLDGHDDPILSDPQFPTSISFSAQEECHRCIDTKLS